MPNLFGFKTVFIISSIAHQLMKYVTKGNAINADLPLQKRIVQVIRKNMKNADMLQ